MTSDSLVYKKHLPFIFDGIVNFNHMKYMLPNILNSGFALVYKVDASPSTNPNVTGKRKLWVFANPIGFIVRIITEQQGDDTTAVCIEKQLYYEYLVNDDTRQFHYSNYASGKTIVIDEDKEIYYFRGYKKFNTIYDLRRQMSKLQKTGTLQSTWDVCIDSDKQSQRNHKFVNNIFFSEIYNVNEPDFVNIDLPDWVNSMLGRFWCGIIENFHPINRPKIYLDCKPLKKTKLSNKVKRDRNNTRITTITEQHKLRSVKSRFPIALLQIGVTIETKEISGVVYTGTITEINKSQKNTIIIKLNNVSPKNGEGKNADKLSTTIGNISSVVSRNGVKTFNAIKQHVEPRNIAYTARDLINNWAHNKVANQLLVTETFNYPQFTDDCLVFVKMSNSNETDITLYELDKCEINWKKIKRHLKQNFNRYKMSKRQVTRNNRATYLYNRDQLTIIDPKPIDDYIKFTGQIITNTKPKKTIDDYYDEYYNKLFKSDFQNNTEDLK